MMYIHMFISAFGIKFSFQKSNTKQIKPTPQLSSQFAIRYSSIVLRSMLYSTSY